MYDVHCHLDQPSMLQRLDNITKAKVKGLLTSGIYSMSWLENLRIAEKYPFNVSLGLHPFFVKDNDTQLDNLKKLLCESSVIAVGEIGLDYYNDYVSTKDIQQEVFYKQLVFARDLNLPVIVHCRKAYDDLYSILKKVQVPALIFHSFSGSEQDIIKMKEFNSYFSFGFPIVNENNKKHRRLVKLLSLDRLLLETDAPYMRTKQMNGENTYSDPTDIYLVYSAVAEVLGMSLIELVEQIERNVKTIWKNFKELSN